MAGKSKKEREKRHRGKAIKGKEKSLLFGAYFFIATQKKAHTWMDVASIPMRAASVTALVQ